MLAEFTIYPTGKVEGVSEEVARAVKIVRESGLEYQLTAMGTILEGDWDEVFTVIKKCHHAIKEDHSRVETIIKIDDHEGMTGRLEGKVRSVEEKMQ